MATAAVDDTLGLFEDRIRRIEHIISGSEVEPFPTDKASSSTSGSAIERLRTLERMLKQLAIKSPAVADVLELHQAQPSLFHLESSATAVPITLSQSSLTALILAHAQLYNTSSANLSLLRDTALPDPSGATTLVELGQRIDTVAAKQDEQALLFAELRARSAKALEQWYEGGVLEMGERWASWEERLRNVEITVRRNEASKRREEGSTI